MLKFPHLNLPTPPALVVCLCLVCIKMEMKINKTLIFAHKIKRIFKHINNMYLIQKFLMLNENYVNCYKLELVE